MDVVEGVPDLQCWFFDKPYTNMNLMQGGTHQTRAPECVTRSLTDVCNPMFFCMKHLRNVCGSTASLPPALGGCACLLAKFEAHCMLCVPSLPSFTCYSSAFGDDAPRSGHLPFKVAVTEFTIMSFVYYIPAA